MYFPFLKKVIRFYLNLDFCAYPLKLGETETLSKSKSLSYLSTGGYYFKRQNPSQSQSRVWGWREGRVEGECFNWRLHGDLCLSIQITVGGRCYPSSEKPPSEGALSRAAEVSDPGRPVTGRRDAPEILGVDPLDSTGMWVWQVPNYINWKGKGKLKEERERVREGGGG